MKMRVKPLLAAVALVAVLSFINTAGAQQSGTAEEAKALLAKAAAAVETNKAGALAERRL